MTIAAARRLRDHQVVFVGIGLPSLATILAQRMQAPNLQIIYESGTIGAHPEKLPLSIGDGEIAETADVVVSVPEIFNYWLQAGRIEVGFLGAAQIDRHANINTTVIGDYDQSPGPAARSGGKLPEIASSAQEVIIVLRHSLRAFVDKLDFTTTPGHLADGGSRSEALGCAAPARRSSSPTSGCSNPTGRPTSWSSPACIRVSTSPRVRARTGWDLNVRSPLAVTPPPTAEELATLRLLQASKA